MSAPLSLTAGLALANQAAKGTAAAAYIRGRMSQSGSNLKWDESAAQNEHTGIHERPTDAQSRAIRTGYVVELAAKANGLYPDLLGLALLGVGFKATTTPTAGQSEIQVVTISGSPSGGTFTLTYNGQTTSALAYNAANTDVQTALRALSTIGAGNVTVAGSAGGPYTVTFASGLANKNVNPLTATSSLTGGTPSIAVAVSQQGTCAHYSHACVIADRDETTYLSLLHGLGEGSARFTRKIADCRFSQLELVASRTGITASLQGMGISEAAASGAETYAEETNAQLTPAGGSFSLIDQSDYSEILARVPGQHTIRFAQSLAEDDYALHSLARADLPVTGLAVTGTLAGVDISYSLYKRLEWGGTSGTGPYAVIPEAALDCQFVTPGNLPNASVGGLLRIVVPLCSVRLGNFEASGNGLVRADLAWQMLDMASTDPITLTLRNLVASYAGS